MTSQKEELCLKTGEINTFQSIAEEKKSHSAAIINVTALELKLPKSMFFIQIRFLNYEHFKDAAKHPEGFKISLNEARCQRQWELLFDSSTVLVRFTEADLCILQCLGKYKTNHGGTTLGKLVLSSYFQQETCML